MKLNDFKQFFDQIGMNIFVSADAYAYIEGIAIKHNEMERHVYKCLAYFSTTHSFQRSEFNKIFDRRTCFLKFQNIRDGIVHLARVSPLDACLVKVKNQIEDVSRMADIGPELMNDLIEKKYEFDVLTNDTSEMVTFSNVIQTECDDNFHFQFYADLHHLICSTSNVPNIVSSADICKPLIVNIFEMLKLIQPLKF